MRRKSINPPNLLPKEEEPPLPACFYPDQGIDPAQVPEDQRGRVLDGTATAEERAERARNEAVREVAAREAAAAAAEEEPAEEPESEEPPPAAPAPTE